MDEQESTRITELKRRVDVLTYVVIVQTVALAYLLPLLPIAVISVLFLLPLLAFTHKRIPAFARRFGRLLAAVSNWFKTSNNSLDATVNASSD